MFTRGQRCRMMYLKHLALTMMILTGIALVPCQASAEDAPLVNRADIEIPAYEPVSALEGRVTITGSSSMTPLLNRLVSDFGRRYSYPRVSLFVESTGSALAIREFLFGFSQQRRGDKARSGHTSAGVASILATSRALTYEELERFRSRYGHDPLEIPIAEDGVAIYVHKDNPVQQLTIEQLKAVFGAHGGSANEPDLRTWGQLGLEGPWSAQPIHLYGRDKESATREFFVRAVLNGGSLKQDVQEVSGPASELLAIARDPLAIGYAGTGVQTSFVRVVPLSAGAGQPAVMPSQSNVADRTYPLARTLYLYVNQDPNEKFTNPVVREFLKFVNSFEGHQIVARTHFHPVSKDQVAKNRAVISGPMRSANVTR